MFVLILPLMLFKIQNIGFLGGGVGWVEGSEGCSLPSIVLNWLRHAKMVFPRLSIIPFSTLRV